MISPENTKILQGIKTSPYGVALQAFLDDQYEIINNVKSCKNWEDTLARQHTIDVLEKLFAFMSKPKIVITGENRKYE